MKTFGGSGHTHSRQDDGKGGSENGSGNNERERSSGGINIAGSNTGFRTFGTTSRSFMQKRMVRESFGPKYPDSERGESRQRASFLMDTALISPEEQRAKIKNEMARTSQISQRSPSHAERVFNKTPRAPLADHDNKDGDVTSRSQGSGKRSGLSGNDVESDGGNNNTLLKKKSIFNNLFSKQRNKR